jgi:hypothetical protein
MSKIERFFVGLILKTFFPHPLFSHTLSLKNANSFSDSLKRYSAI